MATRVRKFNRQSVQHEISGLIKTFESEFVSIERAIEVADDLGEMHKTGFTSLWRGEALVKPISGTVQRLSMGQIETDVISIIIPGKHDFRQGDFVHKAGRLYQVQRTGPYFNGAFIVLDLNLYQQQP